MAFIDNLKMGHLCVKSFLSLAVSWIVYASANMERERTGGTSEISLITDIIGNLANFENAQCIILVSDEQKTESVLMEHLAKNNVALQLLDATTTSRILPQLSLFQSGTSCPYLIMSFRTVQNAIDFIDIHDENLRFTKPFCSKVPHNTHS